MKLSLLGFGYRTRHHQTGQQKNKGGGKQTISAERMKAESLNEKQPKRHAKHRGYRPGEKFLSTRITEAGKSGEAECAEISERAQTAYRNPANLRITAA